MKKLTPDQEKLHNEIKLQAEGSLEHFIRLIHPGRVIGSVHKTLIRWWEREDALSHQLVLLPRDHQKSAMIAYRVAWHLTRNPALRVLYLSSTSNLAVKQLKFIKDILTCDKYRQYWPDMVHPDEGKREKWTETEISVDSPIRKRENVRDPTIFVGGLTTNIVGLHCDIAVFDDIVTDENAYTEDGRSKVETKYSLLASIEGTDSQEWVVGTRYHPKDLYGTLANTKIEVHDEDGNIIDEKDLYEIFEKVVEDKGDGTGEFLWPRQQRQDGKWFGFNVEVLSKKRAQYLDKTRFRAQYYNDPNDAETASISRDYFQYYDKSFLGRNGGRWTYKGRRLNVFAAVDFAYSLSKKADYTTIVVAAQDGYQNYYVLDIDRFKTTLISEYFQHILSLHQKWDFRKIRAEVTAAQKPIVDDLKNSYIRPHGLSLSVDEAKPTRHEGTKEERIDSILQPKYANLQVWHYEGGNCQILEEELVLRNPPHDDVKDALASCLSICVGPSSMGLNKSAEKSRPQYHPRFGGIN